MTSLTKDFLSEMNGAEESKSLKLSYKTDLK